MKGTKPLGAAHPISPALRHFVYLTAGITGGAIMLVEILGAKMLAPYVGTSHFVWTAQIAVTLMALAAGYYAGGRLADAGPRLPRLYGAILVAAVYLSLTVPLVRPLAYGCLSFRLALGSFLASAALFFVPLALLAITAPFLARIITVSVSGVGGNVGRLTAVGTLGSFVGTLMIGYVLVPLLPNSVIMFGTSGVLFALAAVYFLRWGRATRPAPALAAGLAVCGLAGIGGVRAENQHVFAEGIERHRSSSPYGLIQVIESEDGSYRYLLNDYLVQNTYQPEAGQSLSMFTYMLHDLALAYAPRIQNVLCIGLGIGIVPMQFAREGVQVEVVEINPAVADVARDHFGCNPDAFSLKIMDGRYYLNATTNQHDVIILDAFLGDSSPSHLMTREAFAAMRQRLHPQGVLVINCFADFRPGREFFGASLDKTLRGVFRSVRIHAAGNGNVFFVASDQENLQQRREPDYDAIHPAAREQVRRAFVSRVHADTSKGMVLTDDHNPVEFYDAANREQTRRHLAESMRRRR